jgi:hypothetical protein
MPKGGKYGASRKDGGHFAKSVIRATKRSRGAGGLPPTSRSTKPLHTSHQGGRGSKSGGYFTKTVYR